ncbi:MAG TPA: alanyl-tRNA editing protein [Thermoplasmatales archaeon]|nr:alanyl-tRNA editing protein [Thermoplasmatales archaeon]
MTQMLYMADIESNYIREFDAVVTRSKKDYVVLDRSAFYPEGGGQPSDTGLLQWEGGEARVVQVAKKGVVKHVMDGPMPEEGTEVQGILDWERRYAHMQMHTAQHIISGVVFDVYGGRTVGNQIHADHSRVDFHPVNFSPQDLEKIEEACNAIIAAGHPVTIHEESRASLEQRVTPERCNLDLLPASVTNLRIVEIRGYDVCPCAGTHVRSTAEIPPLRIIRREGKGQDRERIVYGFSP